MGKAKKSKNISGDRQMMKKPSFESPFHVAWPEIDKDVNKRIIDELKREIPKHLLGRKLPKRRNGSSHENGDEIENDKNKHPHADHLLLGINAVTKALEKGPLSLVLVCKSIKPVKISHHLIPLCVMQNTDACCVAGLNNAICDVLDLHSSLAVGFKIKRENPLDDLVCFIKDKIPCVKVPWLEIWQKENTEIEAIDKPSQETEEVYRGSEDEDGKKDNLEAKGPEKLLENSETEDSFDEPSSKKVKKQNMSQKKLKRKRKLDEVKYKLFETNYKITEVPVPQKKEKRPSPDS